MAVVLLVLASGLALQSKALDTEEARNIAIYETVSPAVVTINVTQSDGPASGAGVIIDSTGLILTSSHVVGPARTAQVVLASGEILSGQVVAHVGQEADLALIRVFAHNKLPAVRLGQSSAVRVGQKVLAIGNPYGFERTLTLGIVSRIDRERNRLQTDASINPGNSGGPLLNTDGEMIGLNQSIYNPDGRRTNIGISFAVPVDTARAFIAEAARGILTASQEGTLPKRLPLNTVPVQYQP